MPKNRRSTDPTTGVRHTPTQGPGAWVPWPIVESLCRLKLSCSSQWQVLLTVLHTSMRYGGKVAHLRIKDIANMTGLAERTVKAATSALLKQNLLVRVGRYGRLNVNLSAATSGGGSTGTAAPPPRETEISGGADKVALPKGSHACTSPTGLYVSSSYINGSS